MTKFRDGGLISKADKAVAPMFRDGGYLTPEEAEVFVARLQDPPAPVWAVVLTAAGIIAIAVGVTAFVLWFAGVI